MILIMNFTVRNLIFHWLYLDIEKVKRKINRKKWEMRTRGKKGEKKLNGDSPERRKVKKEI